MRPHRSAVSVHELSVAFDYDGIDVAQPVRSFGP